MTRKLIIINRKEKKKEKERKKRWTLPYKIQDKELECVKGLTVRVKNTNLLVENTGKVFHNLEFDKNILSVTLKAKAIN